MPSRNTTDDPPFKTTLEPANSPIGSGVGIHPGRVVWAHNSKATAWDGQSGNWWDNASTDPRLVDAMISGSVQSLTGEKTDKLAWNALFRFFNPLGTLSPAGAF